MAPAPSIFARRCASSRANADRFAWKRGAMDPIEYEVSPCGERSFLQIVSSDRQTTPPHSSPWLTNGWLPLPVIEMAAQVLIVDEATPGIAPDSEGLQVGIGLITLRQASR